MLTLFFSAKASLYLSVKSSFFLTRYCITKKSVFPCILSYQFVVPDFENVFCKSAVSTRSFILLFGFTFFLLSYKFWRTNLSFFYRDSCIGVNLVEECFLLTNSLVIIGKTSVQLPIHFPKTGF